MINRVPQCAYLVVVLLVAGCQSGYRSAAKQSLGLYNAGEYQLAAATAIEFADSKRRDKKDRVAYNLESGRMAQVAGDFENSKKYYDLAYSDVRPFLADKAENSIIEGVVTTILNQTLSEYKSTPGERVMLNALNALNCIALGDFDLAQVELNRAKDWQQDASDRYKKQIEKARLAVEAELQKKRIAKVNQDSIEAELSTRYKGYGDYRNPFSDHLYSIFSIAHGGGNRSNALKYLKSMSSSNRKLQNQLAEDISFLSAAGSESEASPATWIYFMTGGAPSLTEKKLRLPVPIQGINYIIAAFPKMVTHEDYIAGISASSLDGFFRSAELVSMDRILGNEFDIRVPLIANQEIASTILKTIAAKALEDGLRQQLTEIRSLLNKGLITQEEYEEKKGKIENKIQAMHLLTFVGKEVSTSADLRSWKSLPKGIQLIRIATPDDGLISIAGIPGNKDFGQVEVVPEKHNVVVITMPSSQSPQPSVISATLN